MTSAQYNGILAAIATSGSGGVTGAIILFGGAAAPSGYLPCDGSAVSRSAYAGLYAALGVVWGAGDGLTTFNVPDLRGRAPIGVGTGSGLTARDLGTNYGAEGTAVAKANLEAFALDVTDPGHAHGGLDGALFVESPTLGGGAGADGVMGSAEAFTTASATTGVTVASGGSSTPLPTLTPSAGVNYFIKT